MRVVIKYSSEYLLESVGFRSYFLNISLFKAQHPDDYRTSYTDRPLLELTLEFAKFLSRSIESADAFKDTERFAFLNKTIITKNYIFRKLSRMFNTEACLNGSFLSLPDAHFRTSPNNPGIDLDQVITVMEKLRSCNPKIQQLVCSIQCFF
jgi:hypothetical protein